MSRQVVDYSADNIKRAISFQHTNPNSPSFKQYFEYIETFKASPLCLETCMSLASPAECDEVRHFALQSIASYIANRWTSFGDEAVETLKRMCCDLIQHGTKDAAEEKAFIKEKAVQVVCSVAIYSYPGKWPNFFKDLLEIAKLSGKVLELVFRVFKNLREETDLNQQLDLERRENLKQSLNSYNNDIFILVEQFLAFIFPNIQIDPLENDRNRVESDILIHSALDCLAANIQMPLEQVFKGDLVDILCHLSLIGRFRLKALECLVSIVCHKSPALQSVPTKRFKTKVFLVWKAVVQNISLFGLNATSENENTLLELLLQIGYFLILNHKAELKTIFISSLIRAFQTVPIKLLPEILLLWQIMTERKFVMSVKRPYFYYKEMFSLCWQRMGQAEEENSEIDDETSALKANFLNHTSLWMKSVFLIEKPMYIDILEKRLAELMCLFEVFKTKIIDFLHKVKMQSQELEKMLNTHERRRLIG